MTTKLSVLICTRDRPDTVGQAIESVAACDYPTFDLHIMDQSTTNATREIVEALAAEHSSRCDIVYHHLDKAGLSRAYNAGFRVSDGPIVACTDDDVIVPPDWLARIADAFAADPDLGLLYGQVKVPESLAGELAAGTIVPGLWWENTERLFHTDRNFKVWGMGANMAIRRTLLDHVVGFDEAMGGGAPLRSSQDFDFSFRTYRAGFAVLLATEVSVDHYGTRLPEQWPATERNYGIGDGAFYSKHIRCGDLLALRLLAHQLAFVAKSSVASSVRRRKLVGIGDYGRSIFTGVRLAWRFDIDRQHRLYRETARSQTGVTEANAVTGALRSQHAESPPRTA